MLAAALSLGVSAALSGCAPAVGSHPKPGHGHPTAPRSASAVPSPTPSALGPLPANALFRITATVTEPGGATADLVQTVFGPVAPTASDTALLDAQCNLPSQPTWQSQYTRPRFITTTVTATLRAGSKPWNTDDQVASYFFGGSSAFAGDYMSAQAPCADGYIGIPGTLHGVAAVEGNDTATATFGWAGQFGEYGFDGGGNDAAALDSSGTGVVGNCAIEESAEAEATSDVVKAWLTQPFDAKVGCVFLGANPA